MSEQRKINVAALMGGRTAEHEVSLNTGRMVAAALDKAKYNVKPVVITKEGKWVLPAGYLRELPSGGAEDTDLTAGMRESEPVSPGEALARATDEKVAESADEHIDVVFIAMHGPYGEDGTVQGLLEIAGIPYTGSNVLASALAMDKAKSREVFAQHGLRVPSYEVVTAGEWQGDRGSAVRRVVAGLGLPVVTKPAALGSSVGVTICETEGQLAQGIEQAFEYGERALVDEFIGGIEVACGVLEVLGSEEPMALPPTEIVPKESAFFDYHCKYIPGATEEITPARIDAELTATVQRMAVAAHRALGCGGVTRADFLIRDREVFLLEINTIPGMTETSLVPQAAKVAGIGFPELLDRLVQLALEAHARKRIKTAR